MGAYWQHYGMQCEPFTEGNQGSCYVPLQWEQQMGLLQHLSWHSQVVLLVTGLSGIGKTTLLNQFVRGVSGKYHVLKLQGNETLGPDQLLKLLAERLGLGSTHQMGATLKEQVVSQLAVMQSSKQVLLLVVDDAHYLPSSTLSLILDLASSKAQASTALHGILFGGPQLEANMADITAQHLDEDLTHTLRIEPLNLDATDKYLQHGLRAAGYNQDILPFDETEIVDIYHASGGIPTNINRLVQQALQEKVPAAEKKDGGALWTLPWMKVVGALGLFIVLVLGITTFMGQRHQLSPRPIASSSSMVMKSEEARQEVSQPVNSIAIDPESQEPLADVPNAEEEVATMDGLPALASIAEKPAMNHVLADNQLVKKNVEALPTLDNNDHSVSPMVDEPTTTAVIERDNPRPLTISEQEAAQRVVNTFRKAQEKSSETTTTQPTKPINKIASTVAPTKPVDKIASTVAPLSSIKKTNQKKTRTTTVKSIKSPVTSPVSHKTKKVVVSHQSPPKMPRDGFTVQLMGTKQASRAKDFIRAHRLQSGARYYRTQRNGADWYVVVYGYYPNRTAAKSAIKNLPTAVQAQKPWIRSNKSLPAKAMVS
ncbi:MAG: AAA family ATPase [Gammaproteobacteria bacterium]